jgi:hypothetical protein
VWVWTSILGGSAPDFSSPLNAVPVYVSDHREPVFERFCQIPYAMPFV